MKKWTAFVTSLALCLALVSPAFAVEEKELLLPEATNDVILIDTATEDTATEPEVAVEVDIDQAIYDEAYAQGYADGLADKEYPELEFNTEDPAAYSRDLGYDEGFWAGFDELMGKQAQAEREAAISAKGGTPGQINVLMHEKMIAFPDAFPKVVEGRTMIPVRAVTEALGAKVDMPENGKVSIVLGDTQIYLTIGDTTASILREGDMVEDLTLDVAPYINADRTYVPLRFLSETLGYDVFWDELWQTVVLLDKDSIIADFNARFSTLNTLMQNQSKYLEGNWKTTGTMNLDIELLMMPDTAPIHITGKMNAHTGDGATVSTVELDLTSLLPLLKNITNAYLAQQIAAVQTMEVRLTPEGKLYMQIPTLDAVLRDVNAEALPAGDIWYLMSQVPDGLLTSDVYNVGNLFYSIWVEMGTTMMPATGLYEYLQQAATAAEFLMGDDTFTEKNGVYTWHFDTQDILDMMKDLAKSMDEEISAEDLAEMKEVFQSFDVTVVFEKDGDYTMNMDIKLDLAPLGTTIDLQGEGKLANDKEETKLSLNIPNLLKATLETLSETKPSDTAPDTALPEGANVVDYMQLLFGIVGNIPTPLPEGDFDVEVVEVEENTQP